MPYRNNAGTMIAFLDMRSDKYPKTGMKIAADTEKTVIVKLA